MGKTEITKERLIEYGFKDLTVDRAPEDFDVILMALDLMSDEAKENHPDEKFQLVVTVERGPQEFALALPFGCGMTYLRFESMEHLMSFRNAIESHSPEW